MIDDMGGADVCYGGIGWSGHIAYIEPGSEAFAAPSLEEWKKIGPRIVELTPFSILQNRLGTGIRAERRLVVGARPRGLRSGQPRSSAPS